MVREIQAEQADGHVLEVVFSYCIIKFYHHDILSSDPLILYHICIRRLEDSWLGPWRCLLRADHTDFKCLDSVLAKLKRSLECKCKLDANISVLRIIMGGSQSVTDVEACIAQMILYKGCLGRGMCCGAESFRVFSSEVGETKTISDSIRSLILEAFNNTIQDAIEREPIVLVLDSDLQVLIHINQLLSIFSIDYSETAFVNFIFPLISHVFLSLLAYPLTNSSQ